MRMAAPGPVGVPRGWTMASRRWATSWAEATVALMAINPRKSPRGKGMGADCTAKSGGWWSSAVLALRSTGRQDGTVGDAGGSDVLAVEVVEEAGGLAGFVALEGDPEGFEFGGD